MSWLKVLAFFALYLSTNNVGVQGKFPVVGCRKICGLTSGYPPGEYRKRFKRSINHPMGNANSSQEEGSANKESKEDDYRVVESDVDEDDYRVQVDDEDVRIVNGYETKERPWLVMIQVQGGTCGGAIVNTRFVISAAHCFCRDDDSQIKCTVITVEGKKTHKPQYDMRLVKITVGLNDVNLAYRDRHPENIHEPEEIWIRAGWVFAESFNPDLSLVKTRKKIRFLDGIVGPVCFPTSHADGMETKDDPNPHAYVAGWGATSSQCDSNDDGPAPHRMCKFPFVYKGRQHTRCTQLSTPSSTRSVCQQFFNWAAASSRKIGNKFSDSFFIYYWDSKRNDSDHQVCYHVEPSNYGWCGTCYEGELDPGQEGYCDRYRSGGEARTREESGVPQSDKDWGWCSRWCHGQARISGQLMETRLDILKGPECEYFGRTLNADSELELCAARKKHFPLIRKFKRIYDLSTGEYFFQEKGKERNYLGIQPKFDFYVGGTDSCQGDSGGPLIRYIGRDGYLRAVIVGVVSRGTGCANFNSPGIFSRVSFHMDWIRETVGSAGLCS